MAQDAVLVFARIQAFKRGFLASSPQESSPLFFEVPLQQLAELPHVLKARTSLGLIS